MARDQERSWLQKRNEDANIRRMFEQERLVVNVTETILVEMEERGFTKADIASELGKSRAHITKVLTGQRNMTLHTLADLASALGCRVEVEVRELDGPEYRQLDVPEPSIRESALVPGAPEEEIVAAEIPMDDWEAQDTELAVAA